MVQYLIENLPPRKEGYTLDRIDNNKGYEPGNLRWASKTDQVINRRPIIHNHDYDELKKKYDLLLIENKLLREKYEHSSTK